MFRFDESSSRYLIAIEEKHEHSVAPYEELMRRWVARCERGDVFGVVLVNTDEAYDDDEPHETPEARDVAFEEAFTRLLNDFRRDHKSNVARCTVGFVRIFAPRWITSEIAKNSAFLDETRVHQELTSRYMFGVAGNACLTLDEARTWIDAQITTFVPPSQGTPATSPPARSKVGLFYGSTTGATELSALSIEKAWAALGMEPVTAVNIGMVKNLSRLLEFDQLILGVATWNVGQLQDDWAIAFPQLDALDFTGKKIALFGVGDQYGYPDNYLDAVGILGAKLIERGAALVGRWNTDGYEFAASRALDNGQFMGLALDEVQQAKHSQRRITQWVAQIIAEFALQPAMVAGS